MLINRAVDNVQEYIAFLEREPDVPDPEVLRDYLKLRCETTRSAQSCRELLAVEPDHTEANIVLGDLALNDGRPTEAVGRYLAAAKSDPGSVQSKLEQALTARETLLAACYGGTNRDAVSACESHLIPGYEDEGKIRLRLGDIHLLARRFTNATHAYGHASTGTSGTNRAGLSRVIQQCLGESLGACNRAIESTGRIRLLRPLIPSMVRSRCLAVLPGDSEDEINRYCEDELSNMAANERDTIRDLLDARYETPEPVDPNLALAQTCQEGVPEFGWNTSACRALADSEVAQDLKRFQTRIWTALDEARLAACREALETQTFATARADCLVDETPFYLAGTGAAMADLLAAAEPNEPKEIEPDPPPPPPVKPGNDPLDRVGKQYVVTY